MPIFLTTMIQRKFIEILINFNKFIYLGYKFMHIYRRNLALCTLKKVNNTFQEIIANRFIVNDHVLCYWSKVRPYAKCSRG